MSKFEFKLPDIGEGVTEGEIVSWLVEVGQSVASDQDMVEVMTDKATVTIGAPKSGTVVEIRSKEGDVVPVGDVLLVLDLAEAGAEAAEAPATSGNGAREPSSPAAAATAEQPKSAAAERQPRQSTAASAVGDLRDSLPGMAAPRAPALGDYFNDKPLASPATRKFARELGVDLRRVQPTGSGGRVTREDVESHAARATDAAAAQTGGPTAASAAIGPVASSGVDERVPIRGIRKRIFESMARSKHTAAHFTYVDECEASALMAARSRAKGFAEAEGVKLSFLPFIIKAVVAALRRHPMLNTVVDDTAVEMIHKGGYDIGIAVATDAGLIVPVLRNADKLNLLEIAGEVERLANDARAGKTRREDLGGSGFTITSLGKLGGLLATPVVNYPEVAILYVPQIKQQPVVKDGQLAVGNVMALSLSFDHRIIDGHVGAAFSQEVISYLEQPERLMLELR